MSTPATAVARAMRTPGFPSRLPAPVLALVVVMHVVLLALVWRPASEAQKTEPPPLYVSFLAAPPTPQPEVAPAVPTRQPPKPRPAPRLIPQATPVFAAVALPDAPAPLPEPSAPAPVPQPALTAPSDTIPPSFIAAYLDNPAPTYPSVSRHLHESGKVLVRVHVSTDGRADNVEIHTSSGYSRLDDAAVEAVRRWRFVPAKQGSQAMAAWVLVPVNFTLAN